MMRKLSLACLLGAVVGVAGCSAILDKNDPKITAIKVTNHCIERLSVSLNDPDSLKLSNVDFGYYRSTKSGEAGSFNEGARLDLYKEHKIQQYVFAIHVFYRAKNGFGAYRQAQYDCHYEGTYFPDEKSFSTIRLFSAGEDGPDGLGGDKVLFSTYVHDQSLWSNIGASLFGIKGLPDKNLNLELHLEQSEK